MLSPFQKGARKGLTRSYTRATARPHPPPSTTPCPYMSRRKGGGCPALHQGNRKGPSTTLHHPLPLHVEPLHRLQVQENNLDVWIFRGPSSCIGVLWSGPGNELSGAGIIPLGFKPQRYAGRLIHPNLL